MDGDVRRCGLLLRAGAQPLDEIPADEQTRQRQVVADMVREAW